MIPAGIPGFKGNQGWIFQEEPPQDNPELVKIPAVFVEQLKVLGKLFPAFFLFFFFFLLFWGAVKGFYPSPLFPVGSVPFDSSSLCFPEIQGMQMILSFRSLGHISRAMDLH